MKKLLITLSLLLTFGFAASGVAAQTEGVEAPDLEAAMAEAYDVEGLQSVYDRTYMIDIAALMSSPDADMESLDVSVMMNSISIQGMTFDNDDNAKAYIEDMESQMNTAMEEGDAETFEDMEISDLEGFDVDGLRINTNMPDLEVAASMVIFSDGNHVFQVMAMNADLETAQSSADAVTQYVIDADVVNDEITFSEDGTSTGGVFDRMPPAGDEIVGDLTSVMDTELHVAED